MRRSTLLISAGLILAALPVGGCATSPIFQRAVARVAPDLAVDAAQYAAVDPGLSDADRATRTAQARQLAAAAAAPDGVTAAGVAAAWAAVEPWYAAYVAADPSHPEYKPDRLGRIAKFEAMIRNEEGRPLAASTHP